MQPGDPLPRVFLLPGRDRRLVSGHPWVYSNEVRMDAAVKALPPGAVVSLHRTDGKPLGVGTFNGRALIAFRLLSRDAGEPVEAGLVRRRLERALAMRRRFFDTPYYRLVHGEADGLPGVVVDRFAEIAVVQTATAGAEALLDAVLDGLAATIDPAAVVLRNDGAFRRLENLEPYVRVARGAVDGPIEVKEGGLRLFADPIAGQKTGWFYDQRPNRAGLAGLARPRGRVLDVYCYGGAFAVAAAAAGAEALGIDSSEPALGLARRAAEANGVAGRCGFVRADAFAELERLGADREHFDVVVADPPAFVRSKRELKSGIKGYRKLARLAAALVGPGGLLFCASCSHNVAADAFAGEVARGVARAGRSARIVATGGAGPDHPVHPFLAESAYLKTLLLELD
jgi:23S rRNA (cytosine1962-C5)-methyltransferase